MSAKKHTNKPYKLVIHKKTPNVDVYILDQINDEILNAPFNKEKTTAENIIQALQYLTEEGCKLSEIAIIPAE